MGPSGFGAAGGGFGQQPAGSGEGGEPPQTGGEAASGGDTQGGDSESGSGPQAQDHRAQGDGDAVRDTTPTELQAGRDVPADRDSGLALSASMLRNLIRELAGSGQEPGNLLQALALMESPRA